ncbi:MAG: aminopeptidase [Candidatus Cloacimonetes bacterium]|nr:aminopeptidase [Candidatus Cloacimonadota bacterium]MCF7814721.1 aminopeptidase [Candidatus Cloacimonadota bacterium]MCF7869138.1 aminopeptidase [Candidatus Cloacimonadota bacterium]MCF7884593.1 aminopeptidase [Candidatus Cloacimonadota bacterium]
MSYNELVKQQNQKIEKSFLQTLEQIKTIWEKLKDDDSKYGNYLFQIADKILYFSELESELTDDYHRKNDLKVLQKTNREFYQEILPENYEESYANPEFCVKEFGQEMGSALSAYYVNYRSYTTYSFQHLRFQMEKWNKIFIDVVDMLQNGDVDPDEFKKLSTRIFTTKDVEAQRRYLTFNYHADTEIYQKIVQNADLNDIRYLYQYGRNITANEINTAEFLMEYPQSRIDVLAEAITKGFIRGFELAKKDISNKKSVGLFYHLGQEKIVKTLIKKLEEVNLKPILSMIFTTNPNKQYRYDHRFDNALYMNEKFVEIINSAQKEAAEACGDFMKEYAGPIYFDPFGEKPFAPKSKADCLKLSSEQQKLSQKQNMTFRQIIDQYIPRSKSSFCIVGFPLPEIGDQFEEIFEETIGINMMDTIKHEEIQQHIVDTLDKAEFVHVKGKNGNLTDIKIKMHKLSDPARQTNFVNCGADVNIPVGEVFTSPVLKDTNGTLHLKETFLKDLKFIDLNLKFKDGYVEEHSCANFDNEEDNKKYIEENLLFPHKTLPIGEFAIGTNTKAYVMAQKFDILPLLPILIVEKMGPHFAIGDTCFSFEEDFAVFNPIDNKEIIARENERSALRKEDINKAYTNCHTDITLPYEDLDFITAISENGEEFDIIRDGRFVVSGTEELNIPLDDPASK